MWREPVARSRAPASGSIRRLSLRPRWVVRPLLVQLTSARDPAPCSCSWRCTARLTAMPGNSAFIRPRPTPAAAIAHLAPLVPESPSRDGRQRQLRHARTFTLCRRAEAVDPGKQTPLPGQLGCPTRPYGAGSELRVCSRGRSRRHLLQTPGRLPLRNSNRIRALASKTPDKQALRLIFDRVSNTTPLGRYGYT
jgi:hypothetical protein